MKKIVISIFIGLIVICTIFYVYKTYETQVKQTQTVNSQFEEYIDKQLTEKDIASLVNLIHEINVNNGVEYDEEGFSTSENAIKMYISFKDDVSNLDSEVIYSQSIDQFVVYMERTYYEISDIEYNNNNSISVIYVEEI